MVALIFLLSDGAALLDPDVPEPFEVGFAAVPFGAEFCVEGAVFEVGADT